MPTASQIQTGAALLALFMFSVWGLLKAAAGLCGFVGATWYPPALAWGAALNKVATEFHTLGAKIGSLVPGTPVKMAAKRAAARALPPVMLLLCLGGLGATQNGCNLFQSIAKNPIVVATSFEQAANDANAVAIAAFDAAVADLPASSQVVAKADFAKVEAGFQLAMTEVDDAANAYLDGTSQNWAALIADVQSAIAAVAAVIDQYGGEHPASAADAGAALGASAPSGVYLVARVRLEASLSVVRRYH